MAGARIQRKPSFLWHGILILLPVCLPGIVSLASLRRDEQATERDARQRAAENVQSLARALRNPVNDELHQFITLQNVWALELHLASQPSLNRDDVAQTVSRIADCQSAARQVANLRYLVHGKTLAGQRKSRQGNDWQRNSRILAAPPFLCQSFPCPQE